MLFKWMKTQTNLAITDSKITSLEDLVFFPNLTRLSLSNLKLENLSGIENCKNITHIEIQDTEVKDYSLISNLSKLEVFRTFGNAKKIEVDFDNLIDNLKNIETLRSFWLQNTINVNDMKRIGELKGDLTEIYMEGNQTEKIEGLDKFTNLRTLSLHNNKITKIENLDNLTNLTTLYLGRNEITKIENLDNLTNLITLKLYNNEITQIENLDNLTNLITLELYNNEITKIGNVSNLTNLKTLNLQNNPLTDFLEISQIPNLTTLDLRGVSGIDANRENYEGERLEKLNKIGEIIDRGGTIQLDFDKIGLFNNYTTLNLDGKNLETLDIIKGMTNLRTLSLQNNKITLSDTESQEILASLENLENIKLGGNKLTTIKPLNNLKKLKTIILTNCGNVNLKDIEDVISNVVISMDNDTFQTIVNCDSNKITRLHFDGWISSIPKGMDKFVNLKEVYLVCYSDITNIQNILDVSSIESLEIKSSELKEKTLDFSKLTNLKTLKLGNQGLWSDDLENLKGLQGLKDLTLDLSNNSIIDASALLVLDPSTKINLRGNINLETKEALTERFGSNVTF